MTQTSSEVFVSLVLGHLVKVLQYVFALKGQVRSVASGHLLKVPQEVFALEEQVKSDVVKIRKGKEMAVFAYQEHSVAFRHSELLLQLFPSFSVHAHASVLLW